MIASPEDAVETTPASRQGIVAWLPLEKITPHPANPRDDWGRQEIDELAASVDTLGMIQPITVRAAAEQGRYQLIAGERRFRAAKKAGHKTIRAVVRICSDAEALLIMMAENVERRDLNPLQKARLLDRICSPIDKGGLGKTKVEVAKMFGHEACWASNLISLLRLPSSWLRLVQSGEVAETQARALVKYSDRPEVLQAAESDYEMNRWAWRTREDFERNIEELASDPTATLRPPRLTPIDRPKGAERRKQAAPPAPEAADEENVSRDTCPAAAMLSEVIAFIEAHASTEDLELIANAAARRLKRLNRKASSAAHGA